jgi:excisionase family DNA binding protein
MSRATELLVERAAERAAERLTDTLRSLIGEALGSRSTAAIASYISTPQVAELTGLAVVTLESWRRTGEGPAHVRVGRRVLYRRSDVEAWLNANRRGGRR